MIKWLENPREVIHHYIYFAYNINEVNERKIITLHTVQPVQNPSLNLALSTA